MPTIQQLPAATSVAATDLLPLSQGGTTKALSVGNLLSSVQPVLSISPNKLLGRVSTTAGGPEVVGVGIGLTIAVGSVFATGADHTQLPISPGLQGSDEVIVNTGGLPKRMQASLLRSLFTAGAGISIDGIGTIAATGGAGVSGVSTFNARSGTITLTGSDVTAAGGALAANMPAPAVVAPVVNGVAAVGSSPLYARQDHVHPSDTTRLSVSNNLSDILSPAAARSSLGLGSAAMASASAFDAAGSAAAVASSIASKYLPLSNASTYAPLDSPNFTGIPTALTAVASTNTTQVATTAFVNTAAAAAVASTSFSATGSTYARTVADRFADTLALQDAAPSGYLLGSGDDTAAFNSAFLLLASRGGGRLLLPSTTGMQAGCLRISSGLTLPNVAIQVVGEGMATIIEPVAPMTTMFTVSHGETLIEGLMLSNAPGFASSGLTVAKPYDNLRLDLERLFFASFPIAIQVNSGDVICIRQPWTNSCGTSVAILNGMLNSSIDGCYFLGGNGIDIAVPSGSASQEPEGFRVLGGIILPGATGAFGVRVRSGLELDFDGLVIDQLVAAGSNGYLIDSSNYAVRAVKISNGWTGPNGSTAGTGSDIKIIGGGGVQLHIQNHTFEAAGSYGLEVNGGAGLALDVTTIGSRFRGDTLGDVSLAAARATFMGCDFEHSTNSIMTSGTQTQVIGIGNRFVANPLPSTIAGGFYLGNSGNTNDSWDGSGANIGLNGRGGVVVATAADFSNASVFRDALTVVGVLTAPTAAVGTNSAQVATTAFVATAIGVASQSGTGTVITDGASYLMAPTDRFVVVRKLTGSSTAITLPSSPTNWTPYVVKDGKGDAMVNQITVRGALIDGQQSFVIAVNYGTATFVFDGAEWSVI